MRIIIDPVELEKQDLTIQEFLYLLILYYGDPDINKLYRQGYYSETLLGKALSTYGKETVENILLASDSDVPTEPELLDLATKLKAMYPEGKKEGTNFYWTDGIALIIRRLRTFFKKYGKYEDEDILNATQKYINSFNGDYRFMKLLRYFIFKEVKGEGGDVEATSDLLNLLENKNQQEVNNDWSTDVR
jgi:hypothetical protein